MMKRERRQSPIVSLSLEVADPYQLQLDLRMPWNGYDPRTLTKGARAFRLTPEGTPRPDPGTSMPDQLTLFLKGSPYG